jgi:hypothetical protein
MLEEGFLLLQNKQYRFKTYYHYSKSYLVFRSPVEIICKEKINKLDENYL